MRDLDALSRVCTRNCMLCRSARSRRKCSGQIDLKRTVLLGKGAGWVGSAQNKGATVDQDREEDSSFSDRAGSGLERSGTQEKEPTSTTTRALGVR